MAMFEIVAEFNGHGKGVAGRRFDTEEDAVAFLERNGWRKDKYNVGKYTKEGPTHMVGMIGVSISEYVSIQEL